MRYCIFLFALFFSASFGFAQNGNWNITNAKGEKVGQWRDFYENGKLRYTGQFKEGQPYGTFRNFYSDGKIQAVREFVEPNFSKVRFYYQNGDIMAKGYYRGQQKDSLWQTFGADSAIVTEGNYLRDKKYGLWKVYFRNGKVSEETNFVDDLEDGSYRMYFDNGQVRQEGQYEKGALHGISVFYDPKGVKTMKGKYYRGVRHGKWVHYDDQGILKKVVEYDMGKNLTDGDEEQMLDDDSEKFKSNKKDVLEFEDMRGKIKYD